MELKSQEKSRGYLANILLGNRVPPAMLFFGPKGSGKGHLARQFGADYLCSKTSEPQFDSIESDTSRACGVCSSCQQISRRIHPDFIIFSGKDLHNRIQVLLSLSSEVEVSLYRQKAMELLYDLEAKLGGGFFDHKKSHSVAKGKSKSREQFDEEKVNEAIYQFKDLLKEADSCDDVATVLAEMDTVSEFTKPGILPIKGIRKIIEILSKRPLLGDKRVILVEEIDLLRKEGTNAFLKTLEEPPESTVIILTTSKMSSVLPTIRSRCALLPFQKLSVDDIMSVSSGSYGVNNLKKPALSDGLYSYLESLGSDSGEIHRKVVKFIEMVDEADYNDNFFDFLEKDIAKAGETESFLSYFASILGDVIVSRDLGVNKDKVVNLIFSNFKVAFLKSVLVEIENGLAGLTKFNLNEVTLLRSIFMGFFQERIS